MIVGHDWGSIVAWTAALLRPDRFRARRRHERAVLPAPADAADRMMFKAMAGERFIYILYFQEPGSAERELDADARAVMRMMLYSASGSVPTRRDVASVDLPKTARLPRRHDRARRSCPPGSREADLDVYVGEFERTGFRGGLNWYRNFDRNWELLAPLADAKVTRAGALRRRPARRAS